MVEIKISGATPLEALASLTAFRYRCMTNEDVAAAANRIYEKEQQGDGAGAAPAVSETVTPAIPKEDARAMVDAARSFKPPKSGAAAPKEEPPQEPYVEEPPFDPAPAESPESPAKPPALEDVRSAGIAASRKYGSPAVKAILEGFGVANMTSLAEEDRAAFMEALKGLGGGDA